ncbi:hypothetical protein IFM89_004878 [Coptis chinensis]|uniref:Uncharacterized protein n=1 Tax=Coptis chinensis TaxID=261450 RepID=A0A835HNK7_9MAGN|nr:hypothetical protein IFM89_004878 [Coptis chinensis]
MAKSESFDFEKQFAYYGAYHRNPINYFIHMLFVWPILFSFLVLLSFTPSFLKLPHIEFSPFGNLVLNFGLFPTLSYALFYISIDNRAGSLAAVFCVLSWVGGSLLAGRLGYSLAWKKRVPKIKNNLTKALVMEPFFVFLEALQMFFGYEPYSGFHASVQAKIDAELKTFRDSEQKKIS